MTDITLLTRRSPLAMWQAETVRNALMDAEPTLEVLIRGLSTGGDRQQHTSLQSLGGKDLFATDLREQIQPGMAAVHSVKDLSVQPTPGLQLAAMLPRGSVNDALVSPHASLDQLPKNARIGTGSPRRQSQLMAQRPDLRCELIRGNLGTRLQKLDSGEFDAILLASCGLERLQLEHRIRERLDTQHFVPAIGQAAVGIECGADDEPLKKLLALIHCSDTFACVSAERAMNRYLGGSCFAAIGAHAHIDADTLHMRGYVSRLDGSKSLNHTLSGPLDAPAELGLAMGKLLEKHGARELLAN